MGFAEHFGLNLFSFRVLKIQQLSLWLRVPRKSHTASLIRDTVTKEVYVAVVGGYKMNFRNDNLGPTETTEILRNGKWSLGNYKTILNAWKRMIRYEPDFLS